MAVGSMSVLSARLEQDRKLLDDTTAETRMQPGRELRVAAGRATPTSTRFVELRSRFTASGGAADAEGSSSEASGCDGVSRLVGVGSAFGAGVGLSAASQAFVFELHTPIAYKRQGRSHGWFLRSFHARRSHPRKTVTLETVILTRISWDDPNLH